MKFLANHYARVAFFAYANEKEEKALKYYIKAYEAGATSPQVFAGYTALLIKRGEYEKAYQIITDGLQRTEFKQGNKVALRSMSSQYVMTLWKLGRLDEAIAEMEEAHKSLPSSSSYGTLGYLYIEKGDQTGDYTKALEFNEAAMEYDDEDATMLDNLGQVYFRLGRLDEAAPLFEQALEIRPAQVDSMYYMARICLARGEKEKAAKWIEKGLASKISNTATVTREMFEKLRKEL